MRDTNPIFNLVSNYGRVSSDDWIYWFHLKENANDVSVLTTFGSSSPNQSSTIHFQESYPTNYRFNCLFTSEQCFEKGFVDLCLFYSRLLFARISDLCFQPRLNTKKLIEIWAFFTTYFNEIWFLIFMIVINTSFDILH